MAQIDYDDHVIVVRLVEYCELLRKRIEVLEEELKMHPKQSICKVYRINNKSKG